MQFHFLDILWGVGIGIIISIPLGPVALITMKRTAQHGLRAGVDHYNSKARNNTSTKAVLGGTLHGDEGNWSKGNGYDDAYQRPREYQENEIA